MISVARSSALVILLTSLTVVPTTPAGAAGPDRPTCRGKVATIVGTEGATVKGTKGDDVIVSNGADTVEAGAGDDVICTTGTEASGVVYVEAGPGDDVVDRRGEDDHPPFGLDSYADLGPGRDRFIGSNGSDSVTAGGGDVVDGGAYNLYSSDRVYLGGKGQGPAAATVRLRDRAGSSLANEVFFDGPPAKGFDLQLGAGASVDFGSLPADGRRWRLHLGKGVLRRDGVVLGRYTGVSSVSMSGKGPKRPAVEVRGGKHADTFGWVGSRPLDVRLGAGADHLFLDDLECARGRVVTADGGSGRDQVVYYPSPCGGTTAAVDLAREAVRLNGRRIATIAGFEDVDLTLDDDDVTGTVIGDAGPNELYVDGCRSVVGGGDGDDSIYVGVTEVVIGILRECPADSRPVLVGEGGDDTLFGNTSVPVRIVGGDGVDSGRGVDAERDTCDTEVRQNCSAPSSGPLPGLLTPLG